MAGWPPVSRPAPALLVPLVVLPLLRHVLRTRQPEQPRPLVPHLVSERPAQPLPVPREPRPQRLQRPVKILVPVDRRPRRQAPLQAPYGHLLVALDQPPPDHSCPRRRDLHGLHLGPRRVQRPARTLPVPRPHPQRQELLGAVLPEVLHARQHLVELRHVELGDRTAPQLELDSPHRYVFFPLAPQVREPAHRPPLDLGRLVVDARHHRVSPEPEARHPPARHVHAAAPLTAYRERLPHATPRREPLDVRQLELPALHVRVDVHSRPDQLERPAHHVHLEQRPQQAHRQLRPQRVQVGRVQLHVHRHPALVPAQPHLEVRRRQPVRPATPAVRQHQQRPEDAPELERHRPLGLLCLQLRPLQRVPHRVPHRPTGCRLEPVHAR